MFFSYRIRPKSKNKVLEEFPMFMSYCMSKIMTEMWLSKLFYEDKIFVISQIINLFPNFNFFGFISIYGMVLSFSIIFRWAPKWYG